MKFSPSIYEHAAKLINKTPWQVSRDSELLFQAHAEAFRLYHHSPVVAGIDIYNLEAEACGATIDPPEGNGIPAITRHICSSAKEVMGLPLFDPKSDGRIPMVIETGRRLAEALPGANVRIPVSGPFSITSNLVGFETLLVEILTDPDIVLEALQHIVVGQVKFCKEIVNNGLDISFFESSATPPLISPQMFKDVVLPSLKSLMEQASGIVGHPVPCIIGGDTRPILESIMETGTRYVICPSETDQKKFMEKMKPYPDVMVRININPNTLAAGDLKVIYQEVDRVIELAKGREKVCIGTGVLPFEAEPEVVLKTKDYIEKKIPMTK
jgi:uroporphyrinogen decarboxylase